MSQWLALNAPLIQTGCVLALLGYSAQMAIRAGVLSFATVGFYALGGYLSGQLLKEQLWPWGLAMLAAMVVAGLIGAAMALMLTRLKALYLAMATLAVTLFVQALAQSWETYTGGAQGLFLIPRVLPQGVMLLLVALVVLGVWATQRGRWGRATTTLRHDELLSSALGVRVTRYQAAAFVGSAVLGALAGFVQVSSVGVFGPSDIGFGTVVASLTVMVVGGSLSWVGPLLGATLLAALPVYLTGTGGWTLIIQAVILLVVVVYQPLGLAGIARRVFEQRSRLSRTPGSAQDSAAGQGGS